MCTLPKRSLILKRGTSALHLNEATWIIDGSNELIVDFLFALVLFLDSTQPWPFKNPKQIFFFGSNKLMTCKSNPDQHHSSFRFIQMQSWCSSCTLLRQTLRRRNQLPSGQISGQAMFGLQVTPKRLQITSNRTDFGKMAKNG